MLERLKELGEQIAALAGGAAVIAVGVLFFIGEIYWMWTAIKLGSFAMFVLAWLGPLAVLTAPVGAYMMLFGIPQWVHSMFG